ncbi:MAG: ligand-gated channel, partial [Anaerolineales bacterium]
MAETYVLEEIIVRAQKDVGTEDFLEIREIRKTPAVDIGEALDAVEGISIIRKGAIANDVMIRGFNRDNLN